MRRPPPISHPRLALASPCPTPHSPAHTQRARVARPLVGPAGSLAVPSVAALKAAAGGAANELVGPRGRRSPAHPHPPVCAQVLTQLQGGSWSPPPLPKPLPSPPFLPPPPYHRHRRHRRRRRHRCRRPRPPLVALAAASSPRSLAAPPRCRRRRDRRRPAARGRRRRRHRRPQHRPRPNRRRRVRGRAWEDA